LTFEQSTVEDGAIQHYNLSQPILSPPFLSNSTYFMF